MGVAGGGGVHLATASRPSAFSSLLITGRIVAASATHLHSAPTKILLSCTAPHGFAHSRKIEQDRSIY